MKPTAFLAILLLTLGACSEREPPPGPAWSAAGRCQLSTPRSQRSCSARLALRDDGILALALVSDEGLTLCEVECAPGGGTRVLRCADRLEAVAPRLAQAARHAFVHPRSAGRAGGLTVEVEGPADRPPERMRAYNGFGEVRLALIREPAPDVP